MPGDIRIGVFVPNGAQLLDTATVDVLGVMSREYLELAGELVPSHIYAIAPNVSIYYITTPSGGADVPLTAGAVIRATHDYTDKDVAPGRLDMVVVPGPEPSSEFEEGALDWLRRQSETPGVDILSVCTGLLLCGAAGVADGKRVSGPRGMQNVLHKRFPHMKLVGDKYRWVRDGNLWSSGGITNGNDLMAAYARESGRWPGPLVELGLIMTDTGDRGQVYGEGQGVLVLRVVWNMIRGWFVRPAAVKDKGV